MNQSWLAESGHVVIDLLLARPGRGQGYSSWAMGLNKPQQIIQTTRLGIPEGRDGHLPYRFIDYDFAKVCTKNPLRSKQLQYQLIMV